MTHTKSEVESIKANLEKIKAFVEETYVPRLRRDDSVSVDFGEMKRYPNCWEPQHEYSFGFDGRGGMWFRTGGLALSFDHKDAGANVFDDWFYTENLLLAWKQVKGLIEHKLDEIDQRRAALANFEV